MNTQTQVPQFVIDMYRRAVSVLVERRAYYAAAMRAYGNHSRASYEAKTWNAQNHDRITAAVATLHRIRDNAPDGITMAMVKSASVT